MFFFFFISVIVFTFEEIFGIMVSLFNISILSILLLIIAIVHANTLVESSDSSATTKPLYEIYKSMRTDPRFASVPNEDIVAYIYRTYVFGNGDDEVNAIKTKLRKQHRNRHRKIHADN